MNFWKLTVHIVHITSDQIRSACVQIECVLSTLISVLKGYAGSDIQYKNQAGSVDKAKLAPNPV